MLRIKGENISFSREDINILSNINFSVESGQLLWLKGGNGTGKTTLLRIIAGILRNFSGDLSFYQERVLKKMHGNIDNSSREQSATEASKHVVEVDDGAAIGNSQHPSRDSSTSGTKTSIKNIQALGEVTYIGEKSACDENCTVFENLYFWAKLRNRTELLTATLEFFNLKKVSNIEVKKLSSGWKKRVSLSKLLLFNSKIWILDEPFTHLDQESIGLFTQLFDLRLVQRGIIFLVHHGELDIDFQKITEIHLTR